MIRLVVTALLVVAAAANCGAAAHRPVSMIATEYELGPECQVDRFDELVARAICPLQPIRYYLKTSLVPDPELRTTYNQLLNGLLFGVKGEGGEYSPINEEMIARSLPSRDDRRKFLAALNRIKDSVVWADGNSFAVYDIFLSSLFRNDGLTLANRAILDHASTCDMLRLSDSIVEELVVYAKPEMLRTFEALAKCPAREEQSLRILLLSSVALACLGAPDEARGVLIKLNASANGNDVRKRTVRRLEQSLSAIPNDEVKLRQFLGEVVGTSD